MEASKRTSSIILLRGLCEISTLTLSTKVTNMATFPATTGNDGNSCKVVIKAEKRRLSLCSYTITRLQNCRNKRWLIKLSKLLQSSKYLEDSHKSEHDYFIFTLKNPSPFRFKSNISHRYIDLRKVYSWNFLIFFPIILLLKWDTLTKLLHKSATGPMEFR
jgi:hypothetical protein